MDDKKPDGKWDKSKPKRQSKSKREIVKVDTEKFDEELGMALDGTFNSPDIQRLYTDVQVFHDECRLGHGETVNDDADLSDDDKRSLDECIRMAGLSTHYVAISVIIRGLVSYRIKEEKLWRGKAENANIFLQKLFSLEPSTISRYLQGGRVIYHISKKYSLKEIPNNLELCARFSKLDDKDIVPAFNEVMKQGEGKSNKEKIDIAKRYVVE